METTQELYGFVITSKRRERILKALRRKPLRPVEIARRTEFDPANVSKTLFQLEKKKLVTCITPQKSSWRAYMITDLGSEVLSFLK